MHAHPPTVQAQYRNLLVQAEVVELRTRVSSQNLLHPFASQDCTKTLHPPPLPCPPKKGEKKGWVSKIYRPTLLHPTIAPPNTLKTYLDVPDDDFTSHEQNSWKDFFSPRLESCLLQSVMPSCPGLWGASYSFNFFISFSGDLLSSNPSSRVDSAERAAMAERLETSYRQIR